MHDDDSIHAVLARLPRSNEPRRLNQLTFWERYELEYAQLAVLDGRRVSKGTVETLRECADRLERQQRGDAE